MRASRGRLGPGFGRETVDRPRVSYPPILAMVSRAALASLLLLVACTGHTMTDRSASPTPSPPDPAGKGPAAA